MDQDLGDNKCVVEAVRKTNDETGSKKCNYCNYVTTYESTLKTHFEGHSERKKNH